MKHKFKPVARHDIRQAVEARFRARGSLRFHLLLVGGALLFLLYSAYDFWVLWGGARSFSDALNSYRDSVTAFILLSTAAALHLIHYYFRHGRGRERHEADTDRHIEQQLQRAAADELEEQEELVRLQMADKLKNRRLVFWHLALYLGVMCLLLFVHPMNVGAIFRPSAASWQGPLIFAGVWGIGLAAHLLRYASAYGFIESRREATIDQLVEREMRRERRDKPRVAEALVDEGGGISLAEIESAGRRAKALSEKAR